MIGLKKILGLGAIIFRLGATNSIFWQYIQAVPLVRIGRGWGELNEEKKIPELSVHVVF